MKAGLFDRFLRSCGLNPLPTELSSVTYTPQCEPFDNAVLSLEGQQNEGVAVTVTVTMPLYLDQERWLLSHGYLEGYEHLGGGFWKKRGEC